MSDILMRIAIITVTIGAFVALWVGLWMLAKRNAGLAVALLVAALVAGLVWLLEFRLPARYVIDPDLPVFRSYAWTWILGFSLLALAAGLYLVRVWWTGGRPAMAEGAPSGRFPDIDAAWETIRLQLGHARIVPEEQRVFLILSPDSATPAAVVRSAGMQLFAQMQGEEAPIHAYATAEGLLLSCHGASRLGRQDDEGTARLEYLCGILRRLDPDRPVVRGVVLAVSAEWASQSGSDRLAAAVREDLQTIRSALKLRVPVFAVFSQGESLAGLAEFIGRIPESMRLSRCGFALPSTVIFSGELINRGLGWLAGWFDTWALNLMSGDLSDSAGNGCLYRLCGAIRDRRKRWRGVMEAAFLIHRGSEPVLLRGCYLVACGDRPEDQAFAAGLLRGPRSRIIADHVLADWSDEARREDRVYRRAAAAVGLVGGLLTILAWSWIVRQHPAWWVGFGIVLLGWIAAGIGMARRA